MVRGVTPKEIAAPADANKIKLKPLASVFVGWDLKGVG
jgi:hypothetical protein